MDFIKIKIYIKDIPEWLHTSDFYQELDQEDDEVIEVPHLKETDEVNSEKDLKSYLKTCRFWGVEIPKNMSESAINFISESYPSCVRVLYKFPEFPVLLKEVDSLKYDLKAELYYRGDYEFYECDLKCISNETEIWSIYGAYIKSGTFYYIKKSILSNSKFKEKIDIIMNNDVLNEENHINIISDNTKIVFNIFLTKRDHFNQNSTHKIQESVFPITVFNKSLIIKRLNELFDKEMEVLSK